MRRNPAAYSRCAGISRTTERNLEQEIAEEAEDAKSARSLCFVLFDSFCDCVRRRRCVYNNFRPIEAVVCAAEKPSGIRAARRTASNPFEQASPSSRFRAARSAASAASTVNERRSSARIAIRFHWTATSPVAASHRRGVPAPIRPRADDRRKIRRRSGVVERRRDEGRLSRVAHRQPDARSRARSRRSADAVRAAAPGTRARRPHQFASHGIHGEFPHSAESLNSVRKSRRTICT